MKINENSSFIYFVYPFLFDEATFRERENAFEQASWSGRKRPLKIWTPLKFPENDLLPHIAGFLNPQDGKTATAKLWTISGEALQSPVGGLGMGKDTSTCDWNLIISKGALPFAAVSFNLILFCTGVGFVIVDARPADLAGSPGEWLDFLHYFRFTRCQRDTQIKVRRKSGIDPQTQEPICEPFFPVSAGSSQDHKKGVGCFDDIVAALLETGATQPDEEKWWSDVFIPGQMIPFASLFIEDAIVDEIPYWVYHIRNFFRWEKDITPSPENLSLDASSLLSYSEHQWFTFSLDGGCFLAFNAPATDFFSAELPSHLRIHYFLLFILTLHQRFALMMLLDQVADRWDAAGGSLDDRKAAFDRIQQQLFTFISRGYFAQAMQTENHHKCYLKWQEIFQIERLYQEISNEIRFMHHHLQVETDRRSQEQNENLNQLLSIIAWFFAVPTLALMVLDVGFSAEWQLTAIVTAVSFVLGGMMFWILRRRANKSK